MGPSMKNRPVASFAASPFQVKRAGLGESERDAYDALLYGLSNMDDAVALPSELEKARISELYRCVHDDNPLLFCCDNSYTVKMHASRLLLIPHYRMDKEEYKRKLSEVQTVAGKVSALAASHASGIEKVKELHDWFLKNCRYKQADLVDSHELTGPLLDGAGVCEGISRAFKYLCDLVGISSCFVSGTANSEANGEGEIGLHAWNIVTLPMRSGSCRSFHVDVTYDLNLSSVLNRYDYFCLSDDEVSADHVLDDCGCPSCDSDFRYYEAMGLYAANRSDLESLVARAVSNGEKVFAFQSPRMKDVSTDEVRATISEAVLRSYNKAKWCRLRLGDVFRPAEIAHKFNPARMVFEIAFE